MEIINATLTIIGILLLQVFIWGGLLALMLGASALLKHMTEPYKPAAGDRRKGCQPPLHEWL